MASKLLIVIGNLEDEDHIKKIVKNVESGIERWLDALPLRERDELVQILNNIPSLKSIPNRHAEYGTVVSRYGGRILDTTILISPTSENLHSELVDLFRTTGSSCHIAYGGFFSEADADWILQDGLFSFCHLQQIFEDSKVVTALSERNIKVSVSCCKLGKWETAEGVFSVDSKASLEIMDSQGIYTNAELLGSGDHPADDCNKKPSSIEGFSSFLEEGIGNEIGGIFNTLKPPLQEGFLKIRNPCLYIFPGGNGDSAFFAVNGFNMLVNGGACTKPWFWKLVQHVDRVDSVLATHLGSDNLPGLNSFLLRKLQERQVKLPMDNTTPEYQELRRCLVSPDLGPLFINAPTKFLESINKSGSGSPKSNGKVNGASPHSEECSPNHPVLKTVDVVKETLRLSKALNLETVPLVRKPGTPEPVTLFSKIGLGRLDMYVVSPAEGSKELAYVNDKWGCNGKTSTPTGKTGVVNTNGSEGDSSVTNLSSVCCLLVWHPSNPNEKIVRVLFPGNASQTKIFEGLDTLKSLPFLKAQYVTKNILKQKHATKMNDAHPPQKTARTSSAASTAKKPAAAALKKTTPVTSSAPAKKEPAVAAKVSEKRIKADKPAGTRTKPASVAPKSSTARAKATPKTVKTDSTAAEKPHSAPKPSSSASSRKIATSRPGTANLHSKAESKRSASTAKPTAPKPKPPVASKAAEKPKKPQTLTPSKQTADTQKSSVKKSPRPAAKKAATEKKVTTEKMVQKTKPIPPEATAAATPPEDLTPDFKKLEAESVLKPADLPSTGSEEPTTSILSDRHSPEGEDGSTVQYAESPTVVLYDNEEKLKSGQDDEPQRPSEQQDGNYVIMNRPEISEESDMISANGSSVVDQQRSPVEVESQAGHANTAEELISSDNSALSPEDVQQQNKEVKFVNEEGYVEESSEVQNAHKAVERLPTPFHSLQDSSGTTETSPISESGGTAGDDNVIKTDIVECAFEPKEEGNTEGIFKKDGTEGERATAEEDFNLVVQPEANNVEVMRDPPAVTTPNEMHVPEPAREFGSDIHSSFNSSIEGSYELYPTGRSPPPASAQETIAETISDFKHEEIPPAEDTEDPSVCMDTQPHQSELLEDPTMSTDAPDPRFSMSTTSTGSQLARMDPPFSPSEAGLVSQNDPSLTTQRESAEVQEADAAAEQIDEKVTPEPDRVTSFEDKQYKGEFEVDEDADIDNAAESKEQADYNKEVDGDVSSYADEKYDLEEEGELAEGEFEGKQDTKPEDLEAYPQELWTEKQQANAVVHEVLEEAFDLHASQQRGQCGLEEETEEPNVNEEELTGQGSEATEEPNVDKEEFMGQGSEVKREDENRLIDFGADSVSEHKNEEDGEKMPMTGSLASSAQDQGQDDNSEATSLTETGADSDGEQPESGFDYDGPDAKDYEQGALEMISRSDLSLPSAKEGFALHGGTTPDQDFHGHNEEDETQDQECEIPEEEVVPDIESPDLHQGHVESPNGLQRYHPAYVDPSAPLADAEEVQTDADLLKPAELDSPLDVNAKPFIPKTSMPLDQSPTYGAEAHFGQGDGFPSDNTYNATAPTSLLGANNPFLADLMSSAQLAPFNPESECAPPVREPDPCAQDKNAKGATKKTAPGTPRKAGGSPVYVDLAYVPNHGNKNSVGVDFFKKIRAKYYVLSGNDQSRDEPSADVLNHLLEGRRSWFAELAPNATEQEDTNVTVIPTHDTHTVREWYKDNFKELESCNIHMVASGSKVLVQVESIEACKIEF